MFETTNTQMENIKELADEITNLSLQERLIMASQLLDHERYDFCQKIIKGIDNELNAYLLLGKKIISNGGLKTFKK